MDAVRLISITTESLWLNGGYADKGGKAAKGCVPHGPLKAADVVRSIVIDADVRAVWVRTYITRA